MSFRAASAERRLGLPRAQDLSRFQTKNAPPAVDSDDDDDNGFYDSEEEERLLSKQHGEAEDVDDNAGAAKDSSSSSKRKKTDEEIAAEYNSGAGAKKAKSSKPRRKPISENDLVQPNGLSQIFTQFPEQFHSKKYKSRSRKDMTKFSRHLTNAYQQWANQLVPGTPLEEVLWKLHTLNSKTSVKRFLQTMRDQVRNQHVERIYGLEQAEQMVSQLDVVGGEYGYPLEGDETAPIVNNNTAVAGGDEVDTNNDNDVPIMDDDEDDIFNDPSLDAALAMAESSTIKANDAMNAAAPSTREEDEWAAAAREEDEWEEAMNDPSPPSINPVTPSHTPAAASQHKVDTSNRRRVLDDDDSSDEEELTFDDEDFGGGAANSKMPPSASTFTTPKQTSTPASRRAVLDDSDEDDDEEEAELEIDPPEVPKDTPLETTREASEKTDDAGAEGGALLETGTKSDHEAINGDDENKEDPSEEADGAPEEPKNLKESMKETESSSNENDAENMVLGTQPLASSGQDDKENEISVTREDSKDKEEESSDEEEFEFEEEPTNLEESMKETESSSNKNGADNQVLETQPPVSLVQDDMENEIPVTREDAKDKEEVSSDEEEFEFETQAKPNVAAEPISTMADGPVATQASETPTLMASQLATQDFLTEPCATASEKDMETTEEDNDKTIDMKEPEAMEGVSSPTAPTADETP